VSQPELDRINHAKGHKRLTESKLEGPQAAEYWVETSRRSLAEAPIKKGSLLTQ